MGCLAVGHNPHHQVASFGAVVTVGSCYYTCDTSVLHLSLSVSSSQLSPSPIANNACLGYNAGDIGLPIPRPGKRIANMVREHKNKVSNLNLSLLVVVASGTLSPILTI